jgi:hypothetical protein
MAQQTISYKDLTWQVQLDASTMDVTITCNGEAFKYNHNENYDDFWAFCARNDLEILDNNSIIKYQYKVLKNNLQPNQ